MKTITYIDKSSLGKIQGVIGAIYGLLSGIFVAIVGNAGLVNTTVSLPVFGIASIIAFPIIYGFVGYISGYFLALFYNKLAQKIGGIQIELE